MHRIVEHFDLLVHHPEGELPLICDIDVPPGPPTGTLVIVHGFKGYKDYGMFPYLAHRVAESGRTVVRPNLVHSGMTREVETFARPDLFERDTWNRQVHDLVSLVDAIRSGRVPQASPDAPITLLGHSRGGVASILMAGRGDAVRSVISASAPAATRGTEALDQTTRTELEANGGVEVESARTGQRLRINRGFHDEVDADPAAHDVPAHARMLAERLVVVHGTDDQTVPERDATILAEAAGSEPRLVPGGNHVFNVVNPFPIDGTPSPQLAGLLAIVLEVLDRVEGAVRG